MTILFFRCLNSVQEVVDYVILFGGVPVVLGIQEGSSVYVRMGSYEKSFIERSKAL